MKTSKNYFYLFMMAIMTLAITTSCSKDEDEIDSTYHSLFVTCDYFIDMLDTVYERYDAFGSKAKDTSDGNFTVTPIGRLIIVKKKTYASSITYSSIESALKSHYSGNRKVNNVFHNTVEIDFHNIRKR